MISNKNDLQDAHQLVRTSVICFAASFIIGTTLFAAFQFTDELLLLAIGFVYVIAAFIANIIVLINNIISICSSPAGRQELLLSSALLLLNLPVACFYFSLITPGG